MFNIFEDFSIKLLSKIDNYLANSVNTYVVGLFKHIQSFTNNLLNLSNTHCSNSKNQKFMNLRDINDDELDLDNSSNEDYQILFAKLEDIHLTMISLENYLSN